MADSVQWIWERIPAGELTVLTGTIDTWPRGKSYLLIEVLKEDLDHD